MKIAEVLKEMYDKGMQYEAASIISYIEDIRGMSSLLEELYHARLVLYADPLEGYIIYSDEDIPEGIKEGYIEERYIVKYWFIL